MKKDHGAGVFPILSEGAAWIACSDVPAKTKTEQSLSPSEPCLETPAQVPLDPSSTCRGDAPGRQLKWDLLGVP